jgi:hypothetical protein
MLAGEKEDIFEKSTAHHGIRALWKLDFRKEQHWQRPPLRHTLPTATSNFIIALLSPFRQRRHSSHEALLRYFVLGASVGDGGGPSGQ